MEAVLEALAGIDTDQAERLADAWAAGDATEREVLERDLLRRSRTGKHSYELSSAEDAVAAWLNSQTPEDDDEAAFWAAVAAAARGAVDALILDEDLDDADYDLLYGPWAEVMDDRRRRAARPRRAEDDGRSGAGGRFRAQHGSCQAVPRRSSTSSVPTSWLNSPPSGMGSRSRTCGRRTGPCRSWSERMTPGEGR